MKKLKYMGLAACGLALSACGGGSDSEETVPSPFAGAQEVIQTLSDDTVLSTQTYTYLEVGRDGNLSLSALPAAQGLQEYYPVELNRAMSSKAALASLPYASAYLTASASQEEAAAQASAAFQEMWQALQKYYGDKLTPTQLLEQIQDLDGDLHTIYEDFVASGLTWADYIHLYEQIDTYFDGELDEMLLRHFLGKQGLTVSQFLQQLHAAGLNANSFFQQIKAKGLNLADLESFYQEHVLGHPAPQAAEHQLLLSQAELPTSYGDLIKDVYKGITLLTCFMDSTDQCSNNVRAAFASMWNTSTTAVSSFFEKIEKGIVSAATKSFTAISNFFKFATGTYYAEDFSWNAPVNLTGGTAISSNTITRHATLAGVTTYKFKVQVKATVGATYASTGNAQWVKSISTSITDKTARAFTAWGVGGFTVIPMMQPGDKMEFLGQEVVLDQHLVALGGGMVIKSGKNNHSAILSAVVGGHALSLPEGQRLVLTSTKP